MHNKLKLVFWTSLCVLAVTAAVFRSHIGGDGVEYMLMAHSFTARLSPALTPADFSSILPALRGGIDTAARELVADLLRELKARPFGLPYAGFAKSESGELYAIHFWMYSLLAAPFYALLSAFGGKPTLAFPLLNLTFVFVTATYLRRLLPKVFGEVCLLFLAFGTIYYLRWSGPEVMTACSVAIASICVLRRDTALGIFLCAFASTQNPSAGLMIPLILGHRMYSQKFPSVLPFPPVERTWPQVVLLTIGAALFAAASYVFYFETFGVPSLTGKYFTDLTLLSVERAFSFVFDLNQGVIAGVPGLFVATALLIAFVEKRERTTTAINSLYFFVAASVIAAPTFATTNWNSGASVMLRYAYWSCMPIVALVLCTLPRISSGRRRVIVIITLVAQAAAFLFSGALFGKSSYIRHAPIAHWVLTNAPEFYNPDPEIFFERTRKRETSFKVEDVELYVSKQGTTKLLRHWTNDAYSGGLCAPGQLVSGSGVVEVAGGWQYLHPPFRCSQSNNSAAPTRLQFNGSGRASNILLSGWWAPESHGTWSQGKASVLRIMLPENAELSELHFSGHYFAPNNTSTVLINGLPIGELSLERAVVHVPDEIVGAREINIELRHPSASSPAKNGVSDDTRELAYFLKELRLRYKSR